MFVKRITVLHTLDFVFLKHVIFHSVSQELEIDFIGHFTVQLSVFILVKVVNYDPLWTDTQQRKTTGSVNSDQFLQVHVRVPDLRVSWIQTQVGSETGRQTWQDSVFLTGVLLQFSFAFDNVDLHFLFIDVELFDDGFDFSDQVFDLQKGLLDKETLLQPFIQFPSVIVDDDFELIKDVLQKEEISFFMWEVFVLGIIAQLFEVLSDSEQVASTQDHAQYLDDGFSQIWTFSV